MICKAKRIPIKTKTTSPKAYFSKEFYHWLLVGHSDYYIVLEL